MAVICAGRSFFGPQFLGLNRQVDVAASDNVYTFDLDNFQVTFIER